MVDVAIAARARHAVDLFDRALVVRAVRIAMVSVPACSLAIVTAPTKPSSRRISQSDSRSSKSASRPCLAGENGVAEPRQHICNGVGHLITSWTLRRPEFRHGRPFSENRCGKLKLTHECARTSALRTPIRCRTDRTCRPLLSTFLNLEVEVLRAPFLREACHR